MSETLPPRSNSPAPIDGYKSSHQIPEDSLTATIPEKVTSSDNASRRENRTLPSRDVTDENFNDTYVAFIMYCNPSIPSYINSLELRKILRAPPKSDGKTFSPFILFELVRKLENKEIKTWAQLAIELGVEPPAIGKGQSTQKIQQYAVRLKRWMHAMHVDAFFEWLLGNTHKYWTQIPSDDGTSPDQDRDGVPAEEDLALRALLPETRPKRGRRRAEERDNDSDAAKSPAQRPRFESPTPSEITSKTWSGRDAATPASALSGFPPNVEAKFNNWSEANSRFSFQDTSSWDPSIDNFQTPISAYPRSAITPFFKQSAPWNDKNEPQSAILPNKPKSKRKHGPTVSSAWPSSGSASSNKLRGRPPSNRNIANGPFSTFPVKPSDANVYTPLSTPIATEAEVPEDFFTNPSTSRPSVLTPQNTNGRPARLQLQVPRRLGGSVRLATPPPHAMLLNYEKNITSQSDKCTPNHSPRSAPKHSPRSAPVGAEPNPSSPLQILSMSFKRTNDIGYENTERLESQLKLEILGAEWFDSSRNRISRCSIEEAEKISKQIISNLQAESDSDEAFLQHISLLAGGLLSKKLKMTKLQEHGLSIDYECLRVTKFAAMEGNLKVRATVQKSSNATHRVVNGKGDENEELWKQKYLDLQLELKNKHEKEGQLKRIVLEALLRQNDGS